MEVSVGGLLRAWRSRWVALRSRAGGEMAPQWALGLFAGVQGALLSYLAVVVPAMAVYVATSADPANEQVGWPRSLAVGGAMWLLGQGGVVHAAGNIVALIPLGLTALVMFGAFASARRSSPATWGAWVAGVAGHLAVVAVVVVAIGSTGPVGAGAPAITRTLAGATVVAAIGIGVAVGRVAALRELTGPWLDRVPSWLRRAVRGGFVVPAALVAAASVLTLTWGLAGRAATGDVLAALGADPFGGAMLLVGELALVPNLVMWALAWLTGAGFCVGEGTLFSPAEVVGGPMPAVPLLGALPVHAGDLLAWVPSIVVAVGLLVGVWLGRTLRAERAWQPVAATLIVAVVAAVTVGALVSLSAGPVGPGRFTAVGPSGLLVAAHTAVLVLVGAAVMVPMSAVVRGSVVRTVQSGWRHRPARRTRREAGSLPSARD